MSSILYLHLLLFTKFSTKSLFLYSIFFKYLHSSISSQLLPPLIAHQQNRPSLVLPQHRVVLCFYLVLNSLFIVFLVNRMYVHLLLFISTFTRGLAYYLPCMSEVPNKCLNWVCPLVTSSLIAFMLSILYPSALHHHTPPPRLPYIHGCCHCLGWLQQHLPLVWSSDFPTKTSRKTVHWPRADTGNRRQ